MNINELTLFKSSINLIIFADSLQEKKNILAYHITHPLGSLRGLVNQCLQPVLHNT